MRVFRLADGTSWMARLQEDAESPALEQGIGWEAVLFETDVNAVAQRLVYRPRGWLSTASPADLAAALEEGVAVRVRWGE